MRFSHFLYVFMPVVCACVLHAFHIAVKYKSSVLSQTLCQMLSDNMESPSSPPVVEQWEARPKLVLIHFLVHARVKSATSHFMCFLKTQSCLFLFLHLLFSVPVYNKGRELGTREFMYNILKAFYLSSDMLFMSSHHSDKTGNGISL